MSHTQNNIAEFNLTPAEIKVSLILVEAAFNNMGGNRPSDLEHDELTWVSAQDLIDEGYTRHQAAGFFSSLAGKGIIAGEFGIKKGEPVETYLTTEAWKYLDTIWDNREALKAEVA